METCWSIFQRMLGNIKTPGLIQGPQITNQLKLPYNYEEILKDADAELDKTSTKKLYDQLCAGVYLKQKRQKYWIDNDGRNCFKLFAKDLSITWGDDRRYWCWPLMNESGDVQIPVAELLNVCWLEINGRFETAKCSPGAIYEVVFIVKMKEIAYGWTAPVKFRLVRPDGSTQENKHDLLEKPREQWIEIPAGEFSTSMDKAPTRDLEFSLIGYENNPNWKRGLLINGVVIRPK